VTPSIVWFRDDLRVEDHPALSAAIARGGPVVALYVLDEQSPGIRLLGGAARWWLHHSLAALADRLHELRVPLVLRRGAAERIVADIADGTGAGAVYWNRRYGGPERELDARIKKALRASGREATSFAASLLVDPWTVTTGSGTPYSVFTPFWKACLREPVPRRPLPAPSAASSRAGDVESDRLADLLLLPQGPDWSGGLADTWQPGEHAARRALDDFVGDELGDYERSRDEPAAGSTSLLSPRLRWGELSPFAVWHAVAGEPGAGTFLSELGWREFAWHTLFRFPELATRNLRPEFDLFPWGPPEDPAVHAWQRGRTGIPLVDAGMRELWRTGHMHNRVRMVTASFLVKNLLVDWRVGEKWFWDTLVDADAASNPFNWQWAAGSGADAAPYFRIFNPLLQQKRFDPQGLYTSRWAPDSGADPIVDIAESRRAALDALQEMKRAAAAQDAASSTA
jgi:deoxyribodipyrimidine photo-lyase